MSGAAAAGRVHPLGVPNGPPEEMQKSEGSENIKLSDTEGLKSFAYYDSRTFHGTPEPLWASGSALGVGQFLCQVPSWCQPFHCFKGPRAPSQSCYHDLFLQSRYERQSRVSMHRMRAFVNMSSRWTRGLSLVDSEIFIPDAKTVLGLRQPHALSLGILLIV